MPAASAPADAVGAPVEGVPAPYSTGPEYTGFWLRFAAYWIDSFIVTIATYMVIIPLGIVFGVGSSLAAGTDGGDAAVGAGSILVSVVILILSIGIPWAYFAGMNSSERQGTFGKSALGMKVTDMHGNRISFARATGRFFAKIPSGLILMIGYIMQGFTEKRQALHDMMAGTLVVRKN